MNKKQIQNYFKFIAFMFCFAGIPLFMVIFGYFYTKKQNVEILIKNVSKEISIFYTKLAPFADQQKFWCNLFLSNIQNKATSIPKDLDEVFKSLSLICNKLRSSYDFEYLIYHPNKGMVGDIASDTLGGNNDEINTALNFCWKYKHDLAHKKQVSQKEEKALGKVFGPQFYYAHMDYSEAEGIRAKLCWTDSTYKRKLFWVGKYKKCLIIAFIRTESLTDIGCIVTYLSNAGKEMKYKLNFSVRDDNANQFWHSNISNAEKQEIENAYISYKTASSMDIETEHFYVFPKFLRPGVSVLGYYRKADIKDVEPPTYWIYTILLTILIAIFLCLYGWQILLAHKLDKLSIKWKLVFLFFFANGLPLLVLGFIGNDFLRQINDDYIQKIIKDGTAFLQDFDEKYELEFARCVMRKEKVINKVFYKDRKNILNKEDLREFYNGISSDTLVVYLIGSQTQILIRNGYGEFDQADLAKNRKGDELDDNTKRELEFAKRLGHFFLNKINNKASDDKTAMEIELAIESTLRRKTNNFIFEIISKRGSFMPLGFGRNIRPAMIDTFSLFNNTFYDYFMIYLIRIGTFQRHYLERSVIQANRNELGLKVLVWSASDGFVPSFDGEKALDDFVKNLTYYPLKEPIRIKLRNISYSNENLQGNENDKFTEYIAMGFECKHIENHKLIGLYPVNIIEERVKKRSNELLTIAFFSLLMTLSLSLTIIKGFLSPLSEIYAGSKAIEAGNFTYQLPELGRDEFGDMGKIFNDVMVDLQELSVAGAIQEQLLPNSPIKTGFFSLYGKSVAMGILGGDYFDFIEMEDNKFAVALGDVAGHGVGAALIMSMAKAGLIQLDSFWKEPLSLISRLHQLIYMSKTQKQKKIMTFQYLYTDGNIGEAIFSNAGGCFPIIIRKESNKIEELKLPGAALGAFKKGKFTETLVKFEPGDAIVFYTDGIVECKDSKGTMLGYDNLKLLVQKSWNSDAEVFYKNIYKSYLEYIGGDESNAGDDLTIVVLVYNKAEKLGNENV